MITDTDHDHVSTLTLHQLRYGELQGDALRDVRSHLDGCDVCAGRLRAQEQERAAFVVRPVPAFIRDLAAQQAPPPVPAWQRWLRQLAPMALATAAAASVFVIAPSLRGGDEVASADAVADGIVDGMGVDGVVDVVRTRGELPTVEVWVDTGAGPRLLRPEDRLGEGDRVQLAYDPQGASYIALAGRDASGQIEVYTTEAPTGIGLVRAPFALTLDDAPGVQELFVVGASVPLDASDVRAAVSGGAGQAALGPDAELHVARITIRKQDGSR